MKTIDSARALGQAIRGTRIERGLSQQALAQLNGLSRKYIGDLEMGKESVELGSAFNVAATMDIVWNAPDPTPHSIWTRRRGLLPWKSPAAIRSSLCNWRWIASCN